MFMFMFTTVYVVKSKVGEKGGLKYFEFNVISPSIELLIGTQEGTGQDKLDSNSRVLRPQS